MRARKAKRGRGPSLSGSILFAGAAAIAVVAGLAALLFVVLSSDEATRADASDPQLVRRGAVLYKTNCASCHGVNLEGQPNWRERDENGLLPAPPHDVTGHTWHHTDALLFDVTKYGSTAVIGNDYKSNMPGFEDTMSDGEIWAVLAYIKSTWPADIQEIQSELADTRQQ